MRYFKSPDGYIGRIYISVARQWPLLLATHEARLGIRIQINKRRLKELI